MAANRLNSVQPLPTLLLVSASISSAVSECQINLLLFRYLFQHLPLRLTSSRRLALLYLITHRCENRKVAIHLDGLLAFTLLSLTRVQDLDKIGGTSFFKRLIRDNDSHVAYVAARFLLRHLKQEQPKEFSSVIVRNSRPLPPPSLRLPSLLPTECSA